MHVCILHSIIHHVVCLSSSMSLVERDKKRQKKVPIKCSLIHQSLYFLPEKNIIYGHRTSLLGDRPANWGNSACEKSSKKEENKKIAWGKIKTK